MTGPARITSPMATGGRQEGAVVQPAPHHRVQGDDARAAREPARARFLDGPAQCSRSSGCTSPTGRADRRIWRLAAAIAPPVVAAPPDHTGQ